VKIKTESEDSDFIEEHGESATGMGTTVVMQPKDSRHYKKASNFLLKVFGQKQGV